MAKKPKVRVMGLDIAAVNSGVTIIEASPINKAPHVTHEVLFERGFVHGPLRDHTERAKFSDTVKGLCLLYKVELAVIEEYALRVGSTNTSLAQAGESSGMVKKGLWELSMPFMLVPPTSMRSFISVPSKQKDKGKKYIQDVCKEDYGFESVEGSQNRRSNATDAFLHSIIGSMIYFHFKGMDLGELSKDKEDVLFGGREKMQGLIKMPELYFNCDWTILGKG